MRVRLLSRAAGPMGNWPAGAVIEVNEELAEALVEGGYAERAEEGAETAPLRSPGVEEARCRAPEAAVGRRMKRKGGGVK